MTRTSAGWVAVALLLAGCSAGTGAPSAVSSTRPSSSSDLKCDLPAVATVANAGGDFPNAGFVHFPGGAFAPDPSAAMTQAFQSLLWKTVSQPSLFGFGANPGRGRMTYDSKVGRWLPVTREQVSADGLHYAYTEGVFTIPAGNGPQPPPTAERIHLVDVRTTSDRVVASLSAPPFYEVVSYGQDGIYLSAGCAEGCGTDSLKLWRLDAATGRISKVSDRRGLGWVINGGVAWVVTVEGPSQSSQLLRLDLPSGMETIWWSQPAMQLIGLDADGVPLVTRNDSAGFRLFRVPAPKRADAIFAGPSDRWVSVALADRNGTWLGGGQSGAGAIYLYTASGGVQKVSGFPGLPLGPCGNR